jgi:hypothetical protein
MIPYYVLDVETPITQAFDYVGLSWAKYVVSIVAIEKAEILKNRN